jgi:cytochrome c peroxidase
MNNKTTLTSQEVAGFNVYMSKAQCATCHFVPQFNGVKPPYVGSEFEVLGVPNDTGYKALSPDKGRYGINAATETHNAFRTGSIRNATHTAPYMHNGIFKSIEQVIDFYDGGGGAGRGLFVPNQTLSADSLHLTTSEKANLIAFIQTLNERIAFEAPPATLPQSKIKALNIRKPVGEY